MKEYAYFPGCTSCSTGISYEISGQYLADAIGLQLKEIPDWNCCGASAAHLINRDLGLALPARSLSIAEEEFPGLDVLAPCAACYERLNLSAHYIRESEENRSHIEEIIERPVTGQANVISLLQLIAEDEEIQQAIKDKLVKSLNGLKVACYYGCVLLRPEEINGWDDLENPQSMDKIMQLAGAESVDWAFKTECCGASLQVTEPSAGKIMVEKLLRNAAENGAEVMVTACPMCQLNVDMRQKEINRKYGTNYNIPVYFFTELLAMCMGADAKEVGVDKHFYPAVDLATEAVSRPPVPEVVEETPEEAKARRIAEAKAAKAARDAAKAAEAESGGEGEATTASTDASEAEAAPDKEGAVVK